MPPIAFSMLEFLKIGYIGPLCLTLTAKEVKTILGEPQRRIYRRVGRGGEKSLVWKYGGLQVVFCPVDTVKKIIVYPVQPDRWLDLPATITIAKGYPTSELGVANFESYVKHNKLHYFVSKSPYPPKTYTVAVESMTEALFTVEGLEHISTRLSPYD